MEDKRCYECFGRGRKTYSSNTYYDHEDTCHACGGTGRNDTVVLTKKQYEELTERVPLDGDRD